MTGLDIEIFSSFIAETFEAIDEIEPQLVKLARPEDGGDLDIESLHAVFRLFHSMKGSAGFLGLTAISAVTHEAETLLDFFRKGRASLQPSHVDLLCETVDFFRNLLANLGEDQTDIAYASEAQVLAAKFKAVISALCCGGCSGATVPEMPEFVITPAMRKSFVQEADEFLDQAEQALLAVDGGGMADVNECLTAAMRTLHSLKGNSGFMGFADIQRLSHAMETALSTMSQNRQAASGENVALLLSLLDVLRDAASTIADNGTGVIANCQVYLELLDDTFCLPTNSTAVPLPLSTSTAGSGEAAKTAVAIRPVQTAVVNRVRQDVRVDIDKLDTLINLVGELVIAEAMVTQHPHVAEAEIEGLDRAVHLLRRVSRDLQDVAMSARMIPLAGTFRKMIRLVHDLSAKAGKNIELKLLGEDTEVDKTVIEQIADPLVHIVRNAADHGIETLEERAATGKDAQALICIEGRHEGGEVWIVISDDGRGLNRARILAKAKDNNLVDDSADNWPDEQVFKLIFEPGFSTAEKISDISGRGVGMDVVRKNIEKLKGKIDVRSTAGKGSTFILRIPLTLAIIKGMLVRVGKARYTIPILAIRESFQAKAAWITTTPAGEESVRIRDDFYPVLRLHKRFAKNADSIRLEDGILVLVESDRQCVALFVDEILGQQETVIKGLSGFLGQSHGVSGCTILGDGEVSLILDIAGLVDETR